MNSVLNSNFSHPGAARQASQLCRAALYYARLGWPVLPLRPRSKGPFEKNTATKTPRRTSGPSCLGGPGGLMSTPSAFLSLGGR
jgi:hypothetical protein